MKRRELIRYVAQREGLPEDLVVRVLRRLLEGVTVALECEEAVMLRGFGRFEPVLRPATHKTDPRNQRLLDIPERTSVRFVPADVLKSRLNRH